MIVGYIIRSIPGNAQGINRFYFTKCQSDLDFVKLYFIFIFILIRIRGNLGKLVVLLLGLAIAVATINITRRMLSVSANRPLWRELLT